MALGNPRTMCFIVKEKRNLDLWIQHTLILFSIELQSLNVVEAVFRLPIVSVALSILRVHDAWLTPTDSAHNSDVLGK